MTHHTGPVPCPTCDGESVTQDGETLTPHHASPAVQSWDDPCPDCFDGYVPCQNCGSERAGVVVEGVECCAGCVDDVVALCIAAVSDPAVVVDRLSA